MASPNKRKLRNFVRWKEQEKKNLQGPMDAGLEKFHSKLFNLPKKGTKQEIKQEEKVVKKPFVDNARKKAQKEAEFKQRREEDRLAEQGVELEVKVGKDEPKPVVDEKLLEELLPKVELPPAEPEPIHKPKPRRPPTPKPQRVNAFREDGSKKSPKEIRREIIAQKLAAKKASDEEKN